MYLRSWLLLGMSVVLCGCSGSPNSVTTKGDPQPTPPVKNDPIAKTDEPIEKTKEPIETTKGPNDKTKDPIEKRVDDPPVVQNNPDTGRSNKDLIQDLGSADEAKKRNAENVLVGRSAKAVPELIKALDDQDWQVRSGAVLTLGRLGAAAKDALPRLKEIAEKDETEAVRDGAKYNIEAILDALSKAEK